MFKDDADLDELGGGRGGAEEVEEEEVDVEISEGLRLCLP